MEVFFPDQGWVSFDPTPVTTTIQSTSDQFNLLIDSFKLQWYKWVVSFNLDHQINLYTSLWNTLLPESKQIAVNENISGKEFRGEIKSTIKSLSSWETYIVLFIAIFSVSGLRIIYSGYKKQKTRRKSPFFYQSQKLQNLLHKKGFSATPGSTLPSFYRQTEDKHFSGKIELNQLIKTIERARWDPSATTISQEKFQELLKAVANSTPLTKKAS